MTAVITGTVTGMFEVAPVFLDLLKVGKIRALALAAQKRPAALSQVATAADAGLPGFEAASWQGIVAPAEVRTDLVARLNAECVCCNRRGLRRSSMRSVSSAAQIRRTVRAVHPIRERSLGGSDQAFRCENRLSVRS